MTDFTPNKLDNMFKEWTVKGITALCNIMKKGTLLSFEMLKKKFCQKNKIYRYLQMWNYVNKYVKIIMASSIGLTELFRKAYNSNTGNKIISWFHKGLMSVKTYSTLYIYTCIYI